MGTRPGWLRLGLMRNTTVILCIIPGIASAGRSFVYETAIIAEFGLIQRACAINRSIAAFHFRAIGQIGNNRAVRARICLLQSWRLLRRLDRRICSRRIVRCVACAPGHQKHGKNQPYQNEFLAHPTSIRIALRSRISLFSFEVLRACALSGCPFFSL